MPNPRIEERKGSKGASLHSSDSSEALEVVESSATPMATPVAAAVASVAPGDEYVLDAEAQVISNLDYKDLSRDYSDLLQTTPPASRQQSREIEQQNQETTEQDSQKLKVVVVRDQQGSAGQSSSLQGGGASVVSGGQHSHQGSATFGGRVTEPTLNSASSPTNHAIEDTRGYMENTAGYIQSETNFEENQGKCAANQSKKRVWIWFGIIALLAGAAIGISMGLLVPKGGDDEEEEPPIVLSQVLDDMYGEENSSFGLSIATNENGGSMAVADLRSVTVFIHDGDNEWNVLGNKIQAPENTTTATGLLENGTVLIRAPVIVKMSHDGESVAAG